MAQENEYLKLVQDDLTGEIKRSMQVAVDRDPDTEAKLHNLAKRANVPLEAVRLDPKPVERQLQMQSLDYEGLAKQYPSTAQLLADPNTASLAKDDVSNLSALEDTLNFGANFGRSLATGLIPKANAGLWGVAQAAADVGASITEPLVGTILPGNPFAAMADQFAGYRKEQDAVADRWRGKQTGMGFTQKAALSGAESMGMNAVLIPASMLSASPTPMLAGMTAMTGGDAYGQARDKNIPVSGSLAFASSQALVEYATEKLPAVALLRDVGLKKSFGKVLANQLIEEVPGEQIATALQDLNEWAVLNPDKSFKSFVDNYANWDTRLSAAMQTLIATVVATGGQVTVGKVADRVANGPREQRAVEILTALKDGVNNSKTFERAPEQVKDFIAKHTSDGPIENIFIPAEQMAQYFQSKGIDPAAAAAEMGAKNYGEALTTGGDVVVPLADFITSTAKTEHYDGLMPDIRFAQGEMTQREADLYEKNHPEEIQRLIEQARGMQPQGNAAISQIETDIAGQLLAGGMERSTAESYAQLYAKTIANLAQRSGMEPLALHERYGLTINRPMPEILASMQRADANIDPLLDRMRIGDMPKDSDIFGPSLTDFIRSIGGMKDDGGELRRMEVDAQNAPFMSNLIQASGRAIDEVTALAREAGYQVDDILQAIEQEIRGNPVYASGNLDEFLLSLRDTVNQLGEYLNSIGIDVSGMSNEQIRQAMEAAIGQVYDQPVSEHLQKLYQRAAEMTDTKLRADLPLSAQTYAVRYALRNEIKRLRAEAWNNDDGKGDPDKADERMTGGQLVERITERLGSEAEAMAYLAALGVTEVVQPDSVLAQPAFHGTPYRFDKFSLEHMGNGEGAQAYGWGLYFAGNKEVAEYYRKTLAVTKQLSENQFNHDGTPNRVYQAAFQMDSGIPNDEILGGLSALGHSEDDARQILRDAQKLFRELEQKQGQLYEVDIPDDHEYLLWDKPLREQPENVRKAINSVAAEYGDLLGDADLKQSIADNESGDSFYRLLTRVAGSDKNASRDLNRHGVAGIKYLDGTSRNQNLEQKEAAVRVAEKQLAKAKASGNAERIAKWEQSLSERQKELEALDFNYVVFDDNAIQIVNRYYQDQTRLNKDHETMRGYIQFGRDRKFNIALLEKADLSTFLHEAGHFWLEVMGDLAADPNAPDQIKADYAEILKFLKVESRGHIQVEHHELFARATEAYLREGKAPSPELRGLFQKFKAWLTMIYKSIEMLNVTLTDEVRGVFDRIYASDAEIEAAKNEMDMPQLFATAAEAGMTEQEFSVYAKSVADSVERAKDKLRAKLMKQFQREKLVWWNTELDKLREEVAKEVDDQPIYKAFDALTKGELPDGTPFKFDKQSLVDQFGKAYVKRIPRGYGDGRGAVFSSDGKGLHHDAAADLLGYGSGAELIEALVAMRPRKALIEAEAKLRMTERHGDLMVDGTIADEAVAAMHNEERANLLRAELLAIRKKQLEVAPFVKLEADKAKAQRKEAMAATDTPPVSVFREAARGMIGQQQVRDIRPYPYLLAERKASKAAFAAMAKGDHQEAAIQKQRELLNHYLYLEATAALETVDSIYTYARKFTKGSTRAKFGKAGDVYLEQIDDLLDQYEFSNVSKSDIVRREKLLSFIKDKLADDEPVMIPDTVLLDAQKRNYKTLSFDHLQAVRDAIANIEHLVNLKTKLLKIQSQRQLEELVEEGAASIAENGTKKEAPVGTRTMLDSAREMRDGYFAAHRKIASLFQEMDGWQADGFMWNTFMKPINDAANEKALRTEEATGKLAKLYEKLQKPGLGNKIKGLGLLSKQNYPSLGRSMSRADLLALALNYGNEGNRQRIRDGYGWNDQQVLAALNHLEAHEWEFVQGMWDLIDSYWDEIAAQDKRVNGVAPEKVERSGFILPNGRKVEGGYYPIKYDERHSVRSYTDRAKEEADRIMRGAVARPGVDTGFTKDRAGKVVDRKIKLDLGVGLAHIDTVLQTLTHREMLIDINRILGSSKMNGAILDHYGIEVYKAIQEAIVDIAAGEVGAKDAVESVMGWFRSGVTVAGLGLNLTTALMQPLGITQSMVKIGPKWVGRGIARFLGDAMHMENATKYVFEKSDMMRLRSKTQNREINEIRNKIGHGGVMSHVEEAYFYAIVKMQAVVDVPTWLGAYEKYMEQTGNDEAKSIALADQAVIDAQGGGETKDLAGVQRGGPYKKLFTTFYSYFSATWNLSVESAGRTDFRKVGDVGKFMVDMLLLYTVPVVLTSALKAAVTGGGPGDDEDWRLWLAREQLSYMASSLVLLREISSAVQGMYGYSGPAGTRFFSELGKLIKQTEQGEADEALAKAANNTAGILFHYPAGQVQRTAAGFMALRDGSTSNPTALIFGPRKEK